LLVNKLDDSYQTAQKRVTDNWLKISYQSLLREQLA